MKYRQQLINLKKMQGSNDFIIIFQAIHGADNFL